MKCCRRNVWESSLFLIFSAMHTLFSKLKVLKVREIIQMQQMLLMTAFKTLSQVRTEILSLDRKDLMPWVQVFWKADKFFFQNHIGFSGQKCIFFDIFTYLCCKKAKKRPFLGEMFFDPGMSVNLFKPTKCFIEVTISTNPSGKMLKSTKQPKKSDFSA